MELAKNNSILKFLEFLKAKENLLPPYNLQLHKLLHVLILTGCVSAFKLIF